MAKKQSKDTFEKAVRLWGGEDEKTFTDKKLLREMNAALKNILGPQEAQESQQSVASVASDQSLPLQATAQVYVTGQYDFKNRKWRVDNLLFERNADNPTEALPITLLEFALGRKYVGKVRTRY